jgi:succinate dehydrogenase / fumarate reductase flavoprotein subunit
MDAHVGVFRTGEGLEVALRAVRELRRRFEQIGLADHRRSFNTNLLHALELENLLDLAEVAVAGGLARVESRGAHARRDHPTRDDADWLRHTLAFHTAEGPRLDYKPVTITTWKPVERKY